ncbi:MAG: hypothetical protein D6718_01770, partial [Acidobacteria bacterium]
MSGLSAPPPDPARDLIRAITGRPAGRVFLALPTEPCDPARWLAVAGPDAVLWAPPEGPQFAGWGPGIFFPAGPAGADPAGLAGRAARELERITAVDPGRGGAPGPVALGGLAFDPGVPRDPRWRPFGAGFFRIPRWIYRREGDRAWLGLLLRLPAGQSAAGELAKLERLARTGPPPAGTAEF